MYSLQFDVDWDVYFSKLDKSIQQRVLKKLVKLKTGLSSRHLKHGSNYFVEEVGQYRICFSVNEEARVKLIYFVGSHKDYEKWIRGKSGK